jgi:Putative DNA-binding domain
MSVGSPGELLTALATGDFDSILETPEADNLDFKEHPYRLEEDGSKWELCKDVAALANTNGGCLVVGYSTRRGPTDVAEVADKLRPVPAELINPDQCKKVVSSGVYPPPLVTLHRFTEGLSEGHEVFVVEVATDRAREPFLVRRMPDQEGKLSGQAIGIPSRFHDDTIWQSAEEVYQRIRSSVPGLPPPRSKPAPSAPPVDAKAFADHSESRLQQIAQLQEWTDEPLYSLHAMPASPGELDDLHEPAGLGGMIQRPASLRGAGFGLFTGTTDVIDGALVGLSGRGPVVWLEPDGFFTATALGDRSFLGWAINENVSPERKWTLINSLVLVEFTLEFCRLVDAALVESIDGPWLYGVRCRGFKTAGLRLADGFKKSIIGLWPENTKPASNDDWWKWFADESRETPGWNAFRILKSVYQLFGLPPSGIPFTADSQVSEEAIRGT